MPLDQIARFSVAQDLRRASRSGRHNRLARSGSFEQNHRTRLVPLRWHDDHVRRRIDVLNVGTVAKISNPRVSRCKFKNLGLGVSPLGISQRSCQDESCMWVVDAPRDFDEHFKTLDPDHLSQEGDDHVTFRISKLAPKVGTPPEPFKVRNIVDHALGGSKRL